MNVAMIRQLIVTLVSPLRAQVDGMVRRAVIRSVDDAKQAQELVVSTARKNGEEDVEHVQPYGLSFRPPVGSEVVVLSMGGQSAYRVAAAAQHRDHRPSDDVSEGEGGLYLDGSYRVFIAADGTVHLGAKSGDEFVALAQKVLNELNSIKSAFDAHTHPAPGGATEKPTPMPSPGSVAATKVRAS